MKDREPGDGAGRGGAADRDPRAGGLPGARDRATGGGPGPSAVPGRAVVGGRLNLLLTCSSWRRESWVHALPSLLEPMGVASLRAQTCREAERVLRTAAVHIAVVDLGLPLDEPRDGQAEEGGTRILELLSRLESPPPTVVVQTARTSREGVRCMNAALRCGAFAVVEQSSADVERMLEIMRRCLGKFYGGQWPGGGGGSGGGSGSGSGGGAGGHPLDRGPLEC